MPTYEYWCPACREVFEKHRVRLEERWVQTCPTCMGHAMRAASFSKVSLVKVQGGTDAYANPRDNRKK